MTLLLAAASVLAGAVVLRTAPDTAHPAATQLVTVLAVLWAGAGVVGLALAVAMRRWHVGKVAYFVVTLLCGATPAVWVLVFGSRFDAPVLLWTAAAWLVLFGGYLTSFAARPRTRTS